MSAVTDTPFNLDDFVKLGDIKNAIAPLSIDAQGLAQLGFEPVTSVKASKLYHKSSMQKILTAIAAHLTSAASTSS